MKTKSSINIDNVKKEYPNFMLNIPKLDIPEGFATALIGENGAGKTTLLEILSGLDTNYEGNISYFDGETDKKILRESIGYTSSTSYFLANWTNNTIKEISPFLYETFSPDEFSKFCKYLELWDDNTTISNMSDGMKMKAKLATVFARKTDLLILDEPASPLDPLIRERLNSMIREYLNKGNGKKSVFFSTHNISDMESVTDYAIIMEHGRIAEEGFVEDLKEKYLLIKGDIKDATMLSNILIGFTQNPYNCEGICEATNLDKLAGLNVQIETPTLTQISVAILKKYSTLHNY